MLLCVVGFWLDGLLYAALADTGPPDADADGRSLADWLVRCWRSAVLVAIGTAGVFAARGGRSELDELRREIRQLRTELKAVLGDSGAQQRPSGQTRAPTPAQREVGGPAKSLALPRQTGFFLGGSATR